METRKGATKNQGYYEEVSDDSDENPKQRKPRKDEKRGRGRPRKNPPQDNPPQRPQTTSPQNPPPQRPQNQNGPNPPPRPPPRLINTPDPHSRNDDPKIPDLNHVSKSIPERRLPVNYIDMDYHKKHYFLHHVSKSGTYQMDLMFDGQKSEFQCYLVAINVNTRKLYAQSTKIQKNPKNESDFVALGYAWKNTDALILSLRRIINQIHENGNEIELIIMDGEKGMYSKAMQEELEKQNIDIRRDMNYKEMRGEKRVITPDVMNRLVWIYNNKPHKTLSKFFKRKVTPNQMDSNKEMEKEWVKHLREENYKTMFQPSFQMQKDMQIHLWQPPEKFLKRRSRLQKEVFTVEGSIGGNYLVKNKETGEEKLYPRWAMKIIDQNDLEPLPPKTSYEIIKSK